MRTAICIGLFLAMSCMPSVVPDGQDKARYGGESLYAVTVISEDTLCVAGDGGVALITTSDSTFNLEPDIYRPEWLLDMQFVNRSVGWAVGRSGIVATTTDGGRSWRDRYTFVDNNLHECAFLNSWSGLVVGSDGIIMTTKDTGYTWEIRHRSPGITLYGAAFADDSTAVAVGQSGTVLVSTDRGRSWDERDAGAVIGLNNLYGVMVRDSAEWYVYGANGTVAMTGDAGSSWSDISYQSAASLRDMTSVDEYLVAVGDSGTILMSDDPRIGWTTAPFSIAADLYGCAATTDSSFVVVGSGGVMAEIVLSEETGTLASKSPRLRIEHDLNGATALSRSKGFEFAAIEYDGTPYSASPLGEGLSGLFDKDPRINLDSVDCVTFVEQCLASSIVDRRSGMLQTMDRIRYSAGRVSFLTRNHFFVPDWIPANSWLVEDVTTNVGGESCKELTRRIGRQKFLSFHGVTIPQYEDIPAYRTYYIPSADVANIADRIREPMIVVFVGSDDWLIASHVGAALRDEPDGELILRHASSAEGRVVDVSLMEYLEESERIIGLKLLAVID